MKRFYVATFDGKRLEVNICRNGIAYSVLRPDRRKPNSERRGKWETIGCGFSSTLEALPVAMNSKSAELNVAISRIAEEVA